MRSRDLIMICSLLFWPQVLWANAGIVRGGEHDGFTRVTISTERNVVDVQTTATGTGRHLISVSPTIETLDVSRLFDRLYADRVRTVEIAGDAIALSLNCACEIAVSIATPRLVVVDIGDKTNGVSVTLPTLPTLSAGLPSQSQPRALPGGAPDVFALDFTVVDRLTKSIAAQMTETSQISGFTELAAPGKDWMPDQASNESLFEEEQIDKPEDDCAWTSAVWRALEAGSTSQIEAGNAVPAEQLVMADRSEDAEREKIILYLQQGFFEEASDAFAATEPDVQTAKRFRAFLDAVNGSGPPLSHRFGACDPLADLALAASLHKGDIPQEAKLNLMHNFIALPDGLKLLMFPRLRDVFADSGDALFPGLIEYFAAEDALTSRRMNDQPALEIDPDRLAAVTLELRGTDREKDSWQATFASYLDHGRYFDALDALGKDAPLDMPEKERSVASYVEHMTAHADSVTFVQLALTAVPTIDPQPSPAALLSVVTRLREEGFTDEAAQITTLMGSMPESGSGMADGNTPDNIHNDSRAAQQQGAADDTSVQISSPEFRSISVNVAQQQLEQTSALRQELIERLER